MKSLEALLPRILPHAPDCPDPIALDALRTAAIRFCERTRLWRDSDTFTIKEGGYNIVAAPHDAVLHEIESARFDGNSLEPASVSWLDANHPGWRTETGGGGAIWITQTEPDTVAVVPLAAGSLALSTILKPSFDADKLPDWMVNTYALTLAAGALAEIYAVPKQSFFSPDLAGFHGRKFETELDRLTGSNIKGQQRAPVRTKPQFF